MRLIAYDIDGALTKEGGLRQFKQDKRSGAIVGIVTSRTDGGMEEFIEDENLDPDFAESAVFKGYALRKISRRHEAEDKLYYGSWFKDGIQAFVGGWKYKQI